LQQSPLDGTSLPSDVYEQYDTVTLEEQLSEALGDLAECDGAEHGDRETRIYLYGSDAEAMFKAVEPILLAYPLAASAHVALRFWKPRRSATHSSPTLECLQMGVFVRPSFLVMDRISGMPGFRWTAAVPNYSRINCETSFLEVRAATNFTLILCPSRETKTL
jgi:hypothetical protein